MMTCSVTHLQSHFVYFVLLKPQRPIYLHLLYNKCCCVFGFLMNSGWSVTVQTKAAGGSAEQGCPGTHHGVQYYVDWNKIHPNL